MGTSASVIKLNNSIQLNPRQWFDHTGIVSTVEKMEPNELTSKWKRVNEIIRFVELGDLIEIKRPQYFVSC